MLENSSLSELLAPPVVDSRMLCERELVLLGLFRRINWQQQKDILRMLEAFAQLQD